MAVGYERGLATVLLGDAQDDPTSKASATLSVQWGSGYHGSPGALAASLVAQVVECGPEDVMGRH